jgi:hypothetical protein
MILVQPLPRERSNVGKSMRAVARARFAGRPYLAWILM